ncbi:MAG: SprB repeat-containing protein [Flavobacteriales bacterium]|nr:SprB repeat-containing protein [Flavobacteriales bacterium]
MKKAILLLIAPFLFNQAFGQLATSVVATDISCYGECDGSIVGSVSGSTPLPTSGLMSLDKYWEPQPILQDYAKAFTFSR